MMVLMPNVLARAISSLFRTVPQKRSCEICPHFAAHGAFEHTDRAQMKHVIIETLRHSRLLISVILRVASTSTKTSFFSHGFRRTIVTLERNNFEPFAAIHRMYSFHCASSGSRTSRALITKQRSRFHACLVLATLFIHLALGCICPVHSATSGQDTVNNLITILTGYGEDYEVAARATRRYIDYEAMAQLVLGPKEWRLLRRTQQNEFVTAMRQLVEQRYIRRWQRIFKNGRLHIVAETQQGNEVRITSLLSLGKKQDQLIWRLSSREGYPKVVSLAVNDRDLSGILTKRLRSYLKKHGFSELIAWMRKLPASSRAST